MNKILKISIMVVIILSVVSVTLSVKAFTNSDLMSYITSGYTILGKTYKLDGKQAETAKKYLTENPVDDATAAAIKADLDAAMKALNDTGAKSLDKVDASIKANVTALLKSAGAKAGVNVSINTKTKTLTVTDSSGKVLLSTAYSTSGALVYTGANYVVGASVLAIIAVATVLVLRKRA